VNSTFNWKSDKPRGSSNSIWSNEIINKLDEACLENSEDTIPTSHSGGVKRKNRNLDVASSRKGSDRVKNFVLHKKTSWLRKHAIIYQPDDGTFVSDDDDIYSSGESSDDEPGLLENVDLASPITKPRKKLKSPVRNLGPRRIRELTQAVKGELIEFCKLWMPNHTANEGLKDLVFLLQQMPEVQQQVVSDANDKLTIEAVNSLKKCFENATTDISIQMGSLLYSAGFTRKQMQSFHGQHISARRFRQIHFHADTVGAGKVVTPDRIHSRGTDRKVDVLKRFISHCIDNSIRTAESSTIKTSGGVVVPIAKLYRGISMTEMVDTFKAKERNMRDLEEINGKKGRNGRRDYVALRDADMMEVVTIVCLRKLLCLESLDPQSEVHGRQNFSAIRNLLNELLAAISTPNLGTSASAEEVAEVEKLITCCIEKLNRMELFLKSKSFGGFHSAVHHDRHANVDPNLIVNPGCACHCSFYSYGQFDQRCAREVLGASECGHMHTGACKTCEDMYSLTTDIDNCFLQGKQLLRIQGKEGDVSFQFNYRCLNLM